MSLFTTMPNTSLITVPTPEQTATRFPWPANYLAQFTDTNTLLRYLNTGFIHTSEPTSDGLDYVVCHALFNPTLISTKPTLNLPEYFRVFSQNETQYFLFNYEKNQTTPSVYYIDTDVDQWLKLAPDFETFLQQSSLPCRFSENEHFNLLKANHYLRLVNDQQLSSLLSILEQDWDKIWYFDWLIFLFQKATTNKRQQLILDALQTQMLYFHQQVPTTKAAELIDLLANTPTTSEKLKINQNQW